MPISLHHLLMHNARFGYDIWSYDPVHFRENSDILDIISRQATALVTPRWIDLRAS